MNNLEVIDKKENNNNLEFKGIHSDKVNLVYFITVLIAILGFNAILAIISIGANIIGFFGQDPKEIIDNTIDILNNKLIAMLLSQVMIFLPTFVLLFNKKKLVQKILGINRINIVTFFALTVFTYALVPVMSFINILSLMFVKNQISNTIEEILNGYPIVLGILIVAVMPAFVEEILFRGLLYNSHRNVNIRVAILVNGLLFGLLHGNFNQFAYAFFMGAVFALVVEVTGSLLSTIWCHFIINANSLILAYVAKKLNQGDLLNNDATYKWKDVLYWGCFATVALAVAILILIFIAKYNNRYESLKNIFNINTKGKDNKENILEDIEVNEKKCINNINSKNREIFTLCLKFAILLDVIYMISIEFLG